MKIVNETLRFFKSCRPLECWPKFLLDKWDSGWAMEHFCCCCCHLSQCGQVMHICVRNLTTIGSDNGLAPVMNQCWNIGNSNLRNKLQWNFNRNSYIFIHENAFESVICEMAAILCDLKNRQMTLKNNKVPLLCYFKFCASFHSHWQMQTRVTLQKHSIWVNIGNFFIPCDLEIWPQALTLALTPLLSMALIPKNYIWYDERNIVKKVSWTDRRMDRHILRTLGHSWKHIEIFKMTEHIKDMGLISQTIFLS